MKKYPVILVVLVIASIFIYQKRDEIAGIFTPAPEYIAAQDVKVVMYATAWCPYCDKARSLLEDNNIPYVEYDIEESEEVHKRYVDLGGDGVPLLQIRGQVVNGYFPEEILRLAKENN